MNPLYGSASAVGGHERCHVNQPLNLVLLQHADQSGEVIDVTLNDLELSHQIPHEREVDPILEHDRANLASAEVAQHRRAIHSQCAGNEDFHQL